jgi:hypothetical protein
MAKQKSEKVVTVQALTPIQHSGEAYAPGDTLDILESDAQRLVDAGAAKVVTEVQAPA